MANLTCWSFFFMIFWMRRDSVIYVSVVMNSHEFEQFGSLHRCGPRKYIGHNGTRTRYPLGSALPVSCPGPIRATGQFHSWTIEILSEMSDVRHGVCFLSNTSRVWSAWIRSQVPITTSQCCSPKTKGSICLLVK